MEKIEDVIAQITKLEAEREAIYEDGHVDGDEHPRLAFVQNELVRLWDLRRRLEAAKAAGLDHIPVPPPEDPNTLIG